MLVSGEIGACLLIILFNTVALSSEVQFGALYISVVDFHLTNGTIAVYVANPQHISSLFITGPIATLYVHKAFLVQFMQMSLITYALHLITVLQISWILSLLRILYSPFHLARQSM